jgi:hypothetical protein
MSVAKCLGVEDVETPLMRRGRAAWPRWFATEPALGVVDELVALPGWMRRAAPPERDAVLATLAKLGAGDSDASVALVWLLSQEPPLSPDDCRTCRRTSTASSRDSSG